MTPESAWGYAVGDVGNRAVIYRFNGLAWSAYYSHPTSPSRFYSTNIVTPSGVTWFGGYDWSASLGRRVAYINYIDATGRHPVGAIFPVNGRNIYDRPIKDLQMSSDTMGWAVGDPEDSSKRSDIFQYPYPNFTLDTLPAARAILPGGATFFTVTANSLGGFSADVTLSLLDLPPDITYTIVPVIVNAQTMATVYLTTSVSTPLGPHYVLVLGDATFRSGDNDFQVQRKAYLKVTVTDHPVYAVSPVHGPAGTIVTLSGSNFGADPGTGNRSTAANHVAWAGVQMPDANVLSLERFPDHIYPAGCSGSVQSAEVSADRKRSRDCGRQRQQRRLHVPDRQSHQQHYEFARRQRHHAHRSGYQPGQRSRLAFPQHVL